MGCHFKSIVVELVLVAVMLTGAITGTGISNQDILGD